MRHGARAALEDWIAIRGHEPGPLFYPVTKGGKLRARRLSAQAMLYVTQRRGRGAGVEHFSPHDLRRSFISDLLDVGLVLNGLLGLWWIDPLAGFVIVFCGLKEGWETLHTNEVQRPSKPRGKTGDQFAWSRGKTRVYGLALVVRWPLRILDDWEIRLPKTREDLAPRKLDPYKCLHG